MNPLEKSQKFIGNKNDLDDMDLALTTKLIPPHGVSVDGSRIPEKYHIVRKFPIFPKDYADQGYRVYNKDGEWYVVLWPSANPDSKQDITNLSDAVRIMLDELQTATSIKPDTSKVQDIQKAKSIASQIIHSFDKRCTLLKVALDEIARQVSAHCNERGTLLSFLINDLMETFKEIPKQYNSALKISKKEVDQLKVSLEAKDLELQSQSKNYKEQISLLMLERKIEKEWREQINEQIKKWKNDFESYKERAQNQIKIEKEILEHQMEGLNDIITELRLENDSLKEQIQFQRNELLKSEKKYILFEKQIQILSQKNERLKLKLSKSENFKSQEITIQDNQINDICNELVNESMLKSLITNYTPEKEIHILSNNEISKITFDLMNEMYNTLAFDPFDDFYTKHLIVTEDNLIHASEIARNYIVSIKNTENTFLFSKLIFSFLKREIPIGVLMNLIRFYGFYQSKPFQIKNIIEQENGIPLIPITIIFNLIKLMFVKLGDVFINSLIEEMKTFQIEERHEKYISFDSVLKVISEKLIVFYSQKYTDAISSFNRTFIRYKRNILSNVGNENSHVARLDWKNFNELMKKFRTDLKDNDIIKMYFNCLIYSDSIGSITLDAFDTLCLSKQIHVDLIDVPGYKFRNTIKNDIPQNMVAKIENEWNDNLKIKINNSMTELNKNDIMQNKVLLLSNIINIIESYLNNKDAGPLLLMMLKEAAYIIEKETIPFASDLSFDNCLSILGNQFSVLNLRN